MSSALDKMLNNYVSQVLFRIFEYSR